MLFLFTQYNTELVLLSIAIGLINIAILSALLIKKIKIDQQTKKIAVKLMEDSMENGPSIFTNKGFIDPILFMFTAAFMASLTIFYAEVTPKKEVAEPPRAKVFKIVETKYITKPCPKCPTQKKCDYSKHYKTDKWPMCLGDK